MWKFDIIRKSYWEAEEYASLLSLIDDVCFSKIFSNVDICAYLAFPLLFLFYFASFLYYNCFLWRSRKLSSCILLSLSRLVSSFEKITKLIVYWTYWKGLGNWICGEGLRPRGQNIFHSHSRGKNLFAYWVHAVLIYTIYSNLFQPFAFWNMLNYHLLWVYNADVSGTRRELQ